MARRDFENRDPANLREFIERGVILIGGDTDGVRLSDPALVYVSIVVNVVGYGPHTGAIYAYQNAYHGNADEALQNAYEILEDWEMEHNLDYFRELEEEYGDEASGVFTETFDGLGWKLSAAQFAAAIAGTKAEEFIEVDE
jgi:hypothetical protein